MGKHWRGRGIGFCMVSVAAAVAACSSDGNPNDSGSGQVVETDAGTEPKADSALPSVLSVDVGAPGVRAGVRKDANIVITFSEPMDRDSVLIAYQSPRIPSNGALLTWNGDGTVLTVDPSADLQYGNYAESQRYTLEITTLATDLAGNALAAAYPVEFTTLTRESSWLDLQLDRGVTLPSNRAAFSCEQESLIIGDSDLNAHSKAFMTYDISELPQNIVEIERAVLDVGWERIIGDPFGSLGGLLLEHTDFQLPLTDKALSANPLHRIGVLAVGRRSNGEIDVTAALADDYAKRAQRQNRSQYRLSFETPTDGGRDPDALFVMCESGRPGLSVVYLLP